MCPGLHERLHTCTSRSRVFSRMSINTCVRAVDTCSHARALSISACACVYTFMFVCEPIHAFAWTFVREAIPPRAGRPTERLVLPLFSQHALCVPSRSVKAGVRVHVYACRARHRKHVFTHSDNRRIHGMQHACSMYIYKSCSCAMCRPYGMAHMYRVSCSHVTFVRCNVFL